MRCRNPFLVQTEQLQSVTRSRSAVTRNRTQPQWQPPSMLLSPVLATALILPALPHALPEQAELRRIACGLCEPEMTERVRRQQPAARGALQETALNEERLDDFLDGVARLG